MAVKDKIHEVSEETCRMCGQNYNNECRAYKTPNTHEEKINRKASKPLCEYTK